MAYFFSPVLAVRLYLPHLISAPLARHLGQHSGTGTVLPGQIFAAAYSLTVCANWITINALSVEHLPLRQSCQLFAPSVEVFPLSSRLASHYLFFFLPVKLVLSKAEGSPFNLTE